MPTQNLYHRLLNLLGKSDNTPEFEQLLQETKGYTRIYDVGDNIFYEFQRLGFGIALKRQNRVFWMLGFEIATKAVKTGAMESFSNELHAGITATDTPIEVEAKLGVKAESLKVFKGAKGCMGRYKLPPYKFECTFEHPAGSLQAVTVYLIDS